MVPFEKNRFRIFFLQVDQEFEHFKRPGSSVNIIPEENKRVLRPADVDPIDQGKDLVMAAVYVADGKNSVHFITWQDGEGGDQGATALRPLQFQLPFDIPQVQARGQGEETHPPVRRGGIGT